ncbi:hypothetical protein NT06LI_0251 [Listeria innocua FSL J1-023]|nr:hypothetical protein NT06LI_0251 [Listeria innocua FSL J1-023]
MCYKNVCLYTSVFATSLKISSLFLQSAFNYTIAKIEDQGYL